jgi:mRNA-degrading endonuclease RelE of RelBE toxin-antitoxin system
LFKKLSREIRYLPGHVRAQARQAVPTLAENPRPPRARELRDRPGIYRLWLAGRWRIVYHVDDALQIVTILRVRRKDDIDYGSVSVPE